MDPHVSRLVHYLATNYRLELTVRDMAAAAGLSTSRLAHLFKRDTGVAPAEYLKSLRMAKARELLCSTRLLVKEIMLLTGFRDASHFVRDFAQAYGDSPACYRLRRQHSSRQLALPFGAAEDANRKQIPPTDRC